jgi:hypothetical protein
LHCGYEQALEFELNIDLEQKGYKCQRCKALWKHEEKLAMLSKGLWRQIQDGERKAIILSQLYSPTVTALELINRYLDADTDLKSKYSSTIS